MLFQFVKSISQFFSNFFQHRLTPASRLKRSMGMKYSTLSPFVKSNSKFFSIFFKSTARAAFQHLERSGIVIYHTFSFCQINFRKFFDFFQFQPRNNTRSASIIDRIVVDLFPFAKRIILQQEVLRRPCISLDFAINQPHSRPLRSRTV